MPSILALYYSVLNSGLHVEMRQNLKSGGVCKWILDEK
jgi:hypothetical protein